MMRLTETVPVYSPSSAVLGDKNRVPVAEALVTSSLLCNIHRGTKEAQDVANAMGVTALLPALLYCQQADYANLGDRYIIGPDANGDYWVVHGQPVLRSRITLPMTIHVRCLLTLLREKPDGVN